MEIEGDMPARLPWQTSAVESDWETVYAEQLPRVYNYFRYRFGNDFLAEDLTSRTFEKAWRARHRYRSELAGFATWLLRIARNVAVDHLRSHREHDLLDEETEARADGTPEDERSRESDLERLAALVARLPLREQEIVALKYGAGTTNRVIARLTGLSESNVGTILHRVVQTLRREW
jgi:RNA polymerase sigma-70 factor (ECF subfamily)